MVLRVELRALDLNHSPRLLFSGARVWIQGLVCAKQVFYHRATFLALDPSLKQHSLFYFHFPWKSVCTSFRKGHKLVTLFV
jgi:hypothetical protein